jgi:hypothetical protein
VIVRLGLISIGVACLAKAFLCAWRMHAPSVTIMRRIHNASLAAAGMLMVLAATLG